MGAYFNATFNHNRDIKMKKIALLAVVSILNGCATITANIQSNDYSGEQVKTAQSAQLITILHISPTKVKVEDPEAGLFGSDNILVEGVEIFFTKNGQPLGSYSQEQEGKVCEYHLGATILVPTFPYSTRVQPNSSCPAEK